jgi:hypothetical protein
MAKHAKAWMTTFLFKKIFSFFKKSILSGISQTNHHLLILDGHGSHVTLKAIKQTMDFGLDMITLPSHTSHALQPLDISCFKPFKKTFRKKKVATMVISKHQEPDKITFVGWVDKAIEQLLTKDNIRSWIKVIKIWPLNLGAMDERMQSSMIYIGTTTMDGKHLGEDGYISRD